MSLGRVPIRKAAILSYERSEGKSVGKFVDHTNETEEEKITYFIASFKVKNVPIYGRKPPSGKLRLIPRKDANNLWLLPNTNDLADMVTKKRVYADVYVKLSDLRAHFRHLDEVSRGVEG